MAPEDYYGPYGDPDGARADISALDYISFSEVGAVPPGSETPRTRIIVGRQGSGKTVWLRHLARMIEDRDQLKVVPEYSGLPSTPAIIRFSQFFPASLRTEMWQLAWDRAILRSLASQLLTPNRYTDGGHAALSAELHSKSLYDLVPRSRVPSSPYRELRYLISEPSRSTDAVRLLEDTRWDDLVLQMATSIARHPPIYFFVDAVDEQFGSAPPYWLACQKGLFLAIMSRLRDRRLGGKVHVTAALRDLVLSALLVSEHAPRLLHDPHVVILDWDDKSISQFTRSKLQRKSGDTDDTNATIDDLLQDALELGPIVNGVGLQERPWDFMRRHTRALPRDIVTILNAICRRPKAGRTNEAIVECIENTARGFGLAQLALVRNDLLSTALGELLPHVRRQRLAFDDEFLEVYTPGDDLNEENSTALLNLLRAHVGPTISRRSLDGLRSASVKLFGTDVADILWRHGLLGLIDGQRSESAYHRARFHRVSSWDTLQLPDTRTGEYALHPCLTAVLLDDSKDETVLPTYV